MNITWKLTALFLFACAITWAQGTGQINGTVRDASGGSVPGAEVRALQTATNAVRSATTTADGTYVLPNLPLGPYQIEVVKEGFSKFVQSGIVLQVNSSPTVDVALKIGAVSEVLSVEANAVSVETQTTGVGQVIDNQRVVELPLNARDSQQLIILAGAAVGGGGQASNRTYPVDLISVGGAQTNALTYSLDGGTHNEPYVSGPMPLPFPDALQEFKVETSSVPAQYGQHGGGAVNAVTKSGTNTFHGTAFEFLRNGVLNARNALAGKRDGLKRNQYGGVIGGPIKKDKMFFFFGDQLTNTRSTPTPIPAFVPTAEMIAGDFRNAASAACNGGKAVAMKAPFVNNQISPSLIVKPALALLKQPNFPTSADPCGAVTFSRVNNSDEQFIISRIDYQQNDKSSFFGRYMVGRRNEPSDFDGQNLLTLSSATYVRRAHSLTLGNTYLISSKMVNAVRATLLRTVNQKDLPKDFFTFGDLGVAGVNYPANYSKMGVVQVTGGFNLFGNPATPGNANTRTIQFTDDASLSLGSHQIGFGANLIHGGVNYLTGTTAPGNFAFNGQQTGIGFGDLLIGKSQRFNQSQLTPWYVRQYYYGMYLQDSWKIAPRLTLMYGVRWEPYLAPYTKYVQSGVFSYDYFAQGLRTSVYKNAPVGLLFGDDPQLGRGNKMDYNRWNQFAPRLGLSWDPFGNGKTVVRAAAGFFYDYAHLDTYRDHLNASPTGGQVSISGATFTDPFAGYPGGSPFPLSFGPNVTFFPSTVYQTIPRQMKTPLLKQWNLNVQRQFGTSWIASATYLGNLQIHGTMGFEGNPGVFLGLNACTINGVSYPVCSTTANLNQRRALSLQNPTAGAAYAGVHMIDDRGTRNYNGMILSVQRRASRGLTVLANYTWSHCIDAGNSTNTNSLQTWSLARGAFNHGNCELDRRHNFNLSSVYPTPRFSNSIARHLASDWQISFIARALSGASWTALSGLDQALTGTGDQWASVIGNPYAANRGHSSGVWLNPASFVQPALGTYGNLALGSIRGPAQLTFDTAVSRVFRIGEKVSFQIRGEAFNFTNKVNIGNRAADVPGGVDLTLTSPNFGKVVAVADPRIIQVAAKFIF